MHSEQDLLALAAQSGKNDLAFLIKAKEEAKRRMSDNASPENVRAFNTAKDAVEAEAAKLQPAAPGLTFKTQLAAVDWLTAQGFKIKKSKFNEDLKGRKRGGPKIATNTDGHFEASALLAYAQVHLPPLARAEDAKSSAVANMKITADTRLKEVQAQRQELKLQKEQGQLMRISEHEAQLAARAMFFRSELEGFGLRAIPALIQLAGGDEAKLPEALEWWADTAADLMDAWAQDREFTTGDEVEIQGDEPGGEELAEDVGAEG
ncbi:MAG: hypothetical protein KKA55_01770 [Proteobacteria bacterium]|nr:hypothetical protein [Pseudomonadota bacterium]MBU1594246.1 hypothetical protein [Pseudomonadota bacterium]